MTDSSENTSVFSLVPSARLQRYLGRELIADPNLAVIEFVKNAYDAGASEVVLDFQLGEGSRDLVVSDNGSGMDAASFERNWMRPGYSEKSSETPLELRPKPDRTASGKRRSSRKPLGEKGLGRMASGRLGDALEVYTRRTAKDDWLHVTFDWDRFEDMTVAMSDVPIPFDNQGPPFEPEYQSGTIVVIKGLRLKWEGMVPGRAVAGRKRTRLGRLKQDLEWLLQPLALDNSDFMVEVRSDKPAATSDVGVVAPTDAEQNATYRLEFSISEHPQGIKIERTLFRRADIAAELNEATQESLAETVVDDETAKRFARHADLSCGPFEGHFVYNPPPKGKRATLDDAVGHGVLLYRDGALVEPYGVDGNDWLGVEARKAQRQGHALIQPATLTGQVHITRDHNPELVDMANRLGLIENDASSEFLAHVQAEFREFEAHITPELERRNFKSKKDRASESATQRLALARLRMRSVAHALRQPISGLDAEIRLLRGLASDERVPAPIQEELQTVAENAEAFIQRASDVLEDLGKMKTPEYEEVTSRQLVEQSLLQIRHLLQSGSVHVETDLRSERELVLPTLLIVDALAELLTNACESERDDGVRPTVNIKTEDRGKRDVAIEVSDNGTGLPNVNAHDSLGDIPNASKGRPSGGLALVAESMSLVRGTAELVDNSSAGTTFVLVLPGGIDGGVTE